MDVCTQSSTVLSPSHLTCATRKQTLRSLSLSYQKKVGHAWLTFPEYNLWCQQSQILKSRCHTKRRMGAATRARPSFGTTTAKTLRSVFSWRTSFNSYSLHFRVILVLVRRRSGTDIMPYTTMQTARREIKSDSLRRKLNWNGRKGGADWCSILMLNTGTS